ncbi:MAG: hypothetical protein OXF93_13895 [Acidobacteria bacterium]|nr:hypothetical protein [Acidobacteriota bacterium]
MLVQRSLQPPSFPVVGIPDRQVALALARHLQAGFLQGGDDVGAALHGAVLDALRQVVPNQLARVGFVLQAGPQLRRLDVGAVAGLLCPRPRRVVRPAPAVLVVEGVAQRVEGLLPAGRRDVQALARPQVAPCGQDVHVDPAALLAVQDRRPRVAVRVQPCPGRLLELVEDGFDLRVGRPVLRGPRDDGRAVLVLERQRVGDGRHLFRIAAKHLDARARLPGRVPFAEQVVDRRAGRARAAGDELDVHPVASLPSEPPARSPARWRPGGR